MAKAVHYQHVCDREKQESIKKIIIIMTGKLIFLSILYTNVGHKDLLTYLFELPLYTQLLVRECCKCWKYTSERGGGMEALERRGKRVVQ